MRVSGIKTKLSSSDIKSIFDEFVKIEGLNINNIELNNSIKIEGSYEKKVKISFSATIEIINVIDGVITGKFAAFKILNIGFFRGIRSLVLKMALKELSNKGIIIHKDTVEINTKQIINTIPYIDMNIKSIYASGQRLNIEVEDIEVSLVGGLIKEMEVIEIKSEEKEEISLPIKKTVDLYSKGRRDINLKLRGKTKEMSEYLFLMPDIVSLIYRLLKDNRVSVKTKLSIAASVSIVIFPIDFIPDRIPFIGKIDDIAIIFFALNKIVKEVPINVILENWSGKIEFIMVIKSSINFLSDFTKASNVEKLYNAIEEISKL